MRADAVIIVLAGKKAKIFERSTEYSMDIGEILKYLSELKPALIERAVSRYIAMDVGFQEYISMTSLSDAETRN